MALTERVMHNGHRPAWFNLLCAACHAITLTTLRVHGVRSVVNNDTDRRCARSFAQDAAQHIQASLRVALVSKDVDDQTRSVATVLGESQGVD